MEIDVNLVLQELVDELADKIRQIAILRAQVKQMQAAEQDRVSSEHAGADVSVAS